MNKYFLFSISLLMLASAPILIKLSNLPSLTLICWRLFSVSIILFIINLITKGIHIKFSEHFKIFQVSLILFFHFYTWVLGVRELPVNIATITYTVNPIFTAVFAKLILKEKYYLRYFFSMILSVVGVIAITNINMQQTQISNKGILFIIISALFYSLYIVFSKKLREGYSNLSYTFLLNLYAFIISIATALLLHLFNIEDINLFEVPLTELKYILLLAILPSILGHALMIHVVTLFNINWLSIFKLFSPLISSLLAYLFFGEKLSYGHYFALFCMLTATIVSLNLKNLIIGKR